MARPLAPMTARIENLIRAEARGEPHDKILYDFFGITKESSAKDKNRAEQQIYRWRHRPDADAIWQDELKTTVRRRVPGAIRRLDSQVDSTTDWLANKAANDLLVLAGKIGVIKSEETAVQIQVTGMPELGSPEQEE